MSQSHPPKILQLDPRDNAIVALQDLEEGQELWPGVVLHQAVPMRHKFTTEDLPKGGVVTMYGVPVAQATEPLPAGTLLTTANAVHHTKPADLAARQQPPWTPPEVGRWQGKTFMGYHRPDGRVGTANYWLFVPLVFCENRNLKVLEDTLTRALGYHQPSSYEAKIAERLARFGAVPQQEQRHKPFDNIDGLRFLYHHGGCGGTQKDSEALLRLLAGYVNHPNVAGATVLSLGCQHAQVSWFQRISKQLYPAVEKPVIFLEQQELKTEENLILSALDQTLAGLEEANKVQRQPAPLSKLVVGLECGGSDAFSGISANPVLGALSDRLVALGGATMLSEFPELNGVEQDLVNRSVSDEVAAKFLSIQQAYEASAQRVGSGFDMNPSPGNIREGLITDAIKSAGAAKKGGTAPVADVLDYAEPLTTPGLNLLCTPGNDVESTTGLAGSGANMILFTTGLGTPTGNPVTPVVKVASSDQLAQRMPDIIDFSAGRVITGEQTVEQAAEELLQLVVEVASGKPTKAMQLQQNDFIPWKRGVSL